LLKEGGFEVRCYTEPAKQIPIKAEVDVLVIGSGPAGFSAAVNAARQGVRTMLIEQTGSVGGIATVGLMSHWTGNTKGGFYEEILEHSKDCDDPQIINPEKLKTVMLDMLYEEGVMLQLYTFACDVIMEDNVIRAFL
jgi:alkyl hydroperoxide reductase subunit AhpF